MFQTSSPLRVNAGVALSDATDTALATIRAYHGSHNVWEYVPADVPPTLARFRELGLQLVVVSNAIIGYIQEARAQQEMLALATLTVLEEEDLIARVEGKDPLTGGEPMETRCMAACVGKIRLQGLVKVGEDGLWAEDRWNPLYYSIRVEQVALPLYPQWGTEPNGFYIPPRQAPRGYIRQMFGPGVDNAIEKYLVPSRELLAVLQLWRASQQILFRYDVIPGPKVSVPVPVCWMKLFWKVPSKTPVLKPRAFRCEEM